MAVAVSANATHGKVASHQRQLAERMAVLATEGPAKGPLVVAVGNSLLREALEGDPQLEASLRARHGDRPIRHWNMARGGLQLSEFEPHWDHLTRLRPDVVIIQRDFIAAPPGPEGDGRTIQQVRRFLIATLLPAGSLLAPDQPGVWNEDNVNGRVEDLLANSAYKQPISRRVISRLRALLDAGVHVVVIAVPRAARFEPLSADARAAWTCRLAQDEALRGRIAFLSFVGTLRDNQYRDGAHLNKQGQRTFSAWYAGAVARLVAKDLPAPSPIGTRTPARQP
jgi:hypothetical protein